MERFAERSGEGTDEKEVAKATQLGRAPHIEIDANRAVCQSETAKVHSFQSLEPDGCFPAQLIRNTEQRAGVSKATGIGT